MSRTPRTYIVYGFGSTHTALDAEAILGDMGIEVVPIPAPKEIGAHCGIALRVDPQDAPRAERYLENAGTKPVSRVEIEDV